MRCFCPCFSHESFDNSLAEQVAISQPGPAEVLNPTEYATSPVFPTRRTASVKACLGIEHYNFLADFGTNNYDEAVTPPHALMGTARGGQESQQLSADPSASEADVSTSPESSSSGVLLRVSPALPEAMRRRKWTSADYQVLDTIHNGHSSVVYKAQCQASGLIVAVKVYKLGELPELQRLHLCREIKLHSLLHHPNVIGFYAAFMEDDNVLIIEEFADGGDLLGVMFKYGGKIPEHAFLKLVAVPLLSAVQHLHSKGILHRDIKPENVLFTADRTPKLADLGLAIDMREERPNSNAGTLDYMAPEVLSCPLKRTPQQNKDNPSAPGYGPEADAWAIGAVTYEMLVGQAPFKGVTEEDTTNLILTGELRLPKLLSDDAKDFMRRALARDRAERLRVADMLEHPWIRSAECLPDASDPLETDEPDILTYVADGGSALAVNLGPLPDLNEGDSEGVVDEDDEILASRTVDSYNRTHTAAMSQLDFGGGGSRHGGNAYFAMGGGLSRLGSIGNNNGGMGGLPSSIHGSRGLLGVGAGGLGSRPESSHGGWRQTGAILGCSPSGGGGLGGGVTLAAMFARSSSLSRNSSR